MDKKHLLDLANTYAAHVDRSAYRVAERAGLHNRLFVRLANGGGCRVCTGTAWHLLPTGRPVTATQTDTTAGRLLKVGDFGLGITGDAPTLANIDAIDIGAGVSRATTATTGTIPSGASQFAHVLAHRYSANSIWQQYAPVGNAGAAGAGKAWHRSYNLSTTSWLPWRLIYDQASILGTVSQSGGVCRQSESCLQQSTLDV